MPERPVYLFATMDCEAPLDAPCPPWGVDGPRSRDQAARSTDAFEAILRQAGLVGTYFIVPQLAGQDPAYWQAIGRRGGELGLHVHAQLLTQPGKWAKFLGQYEPPVQRQILAEAVDQWADAMGFRPSVFRPGNFSGDPGLYDWLGELGLVAGSVALPGRQHEQYAAHWPAEPTSAALLPADREPQKAFLDVPVTTGPGRAATLGDPLHLRVDDIDQADMVAEIVAAALARHRPDHPLPMTITFMTHNIVPFDRPEMADRLRRWLDAIDRTVASCGFTRGNTTLAEFRRHCLSLQGTS
jgi:hypothetical protein